MLAKEKWMGGDVPGARVVLHQAFDANLESEQIWLAAVKLEVENNELQAAKEILNRATNVAGTERVRRFFSQVRSRSYPTIDLDEGRCVRTTARQSRGGDGYGEHRAREVSQICQVLHGQGSDVAVSE